MKIKLSAVKTSLDRNTRFRLRVFRFCIICIAFIFVGIAIGHRVNETGRISEQKYILSDFTFENFSELLSNSFASSLFDLAIILASALSAFTFFCLPAIHLITAFVGMAYGFGIYLTLAASESSFIFSLLYITSSLLFVVCLSIFNTYTVDTNRIFVSQRPKTKASPFVSDKLIHFLFNYVKSSIIVTLIHLFIGVAFAILNI